MNFKKHFDGCFRSDSVTNHHGVRHFGQIKKDGRNWDAEIRNSETGKIDRFAGIWTSKKDAVEEIKFILNQPDYSY